MNEEKGQLTVDHQWKRSGEVIKEESSQETFKAYRFPEGVEPAKAALGYKVTINIGNYESFSVNAFVSLPCAKEEVDRAFNAAERIVEGRIDKSVKEIRSRVKSVMAEATTK